MKKNLHFFYVLVVVILLASFQVSRAQRVKKPPLKVYENGGSFDFNWGVDYKKRSNMKSRLIDFLKNQLSAKKRSRVKAAFYTLEGEPFFSTFYIEPDKNGRWVIIEKWRRSCCILAIMNKQQRKPVIIKGVTIYETFELLEPVLRKRTPS